MKGRACRAAVLTERWRRWLTLLAAACCWIGTGSARASGFPDFDTAREQVLHGRVRPGEPSVTGHADALGDWVEAEGMLTLPPQETRGNRFWVARAQPSELAEGLVRARIVPGDRLDAALLFRTTVGTSLDALSGYELSLNDDTLRLQRWDRGRALPIGPEVQVRQLPRARSLEVVVYLVGPQLLATVYDGDTLARLASLAARETTYARGRVGFRAGRRTQGTKFGLLSVMDSTQPPPPRRGSGRHGALKLYGLDADPGTTPFGNTRFVFIPNSHVRQLPRELRGRVQTRLHGPHGTTEAVVFTDTVGLERMRRRGIEIRVTDSNVPWKTFDPAYRAQANRKPTRTRRGFRLDLSYKNPSMVEDLLRGYQALYSNIAAIVELGHSHQGRPILGLKISDHPEADEAEPSILLNGCHHASELLSVEYPLDAAATLLERYGKDQSATQWVDDLEIFVVPMVNPDGAHMFIEESRFAGRKNARDTNMDGFSDPFEGVDLNRNYAFGWGQTGSSSVQASKYYRGPHPGSEPETWAMMSLAERQHFAASISFHTVGNALFVPYTVDVEQALAPSPNAPLVIAEEIAAAGAVQPNDKKLRVRPNGYPVAGSDQDWLRHRYGTVAYILEGSHHNPPLETRTRAVEATRPVWQALLERVRSGPRISGRVLDRAGKALHAEVHIEQVHLRAKERWTTRAHDGRFDRLMARPGSYTVHARAPGYAAAHIDVQVRRPVTVDIILDEA